jgi:hypothetical protein
MSVNTDNAELYENIGDIVIQKAHAGDKTCLRLFELAFRKTGSGKQKQNENENRNEN